MILNRQCSVLILLCTVFINTTVCSAAPNDMATTAANASNKSVISVAEYPMTKALVALDSQNAVYAFEITAHSKNIQNSQDEIKLAEEALSASQKILANDLTIYGQRLREIYKQGLLEYHQILLDANDLSDLAAKYAALKKTTAQDLALLQNINTQQAYIDFKKKEIAQLKEIILQNEQEIQRKNKVLAENIIKRPDIYAGSQQEKALAESLNRPAPEVTGPLVTNLVNQIQNGGFSIATSSGKMLWPYVDVVTSPYGVRIHPIFGTTKFHSGLDIAADYNAPILAADSGQVIYAGEFGAYGNLIILDHGNNLATFYAHNNYLNVSLGDLVHKGQTIALAGSTGNSTGPHLHFEVLLHGDDVDPTSYLP